MTEPHEESEVGGVRGTLPLEQIVEQDSLDFINSIEAQRIRFSVALFEEYRATIIRYCNDVYKNSTELVSLLDQKGFSDEGVLKQLKRELGVISEEAPRLKKSMELAEQTIVDSLLDYFSKTSFLSSHFDQNYYLDVFYEEPKHEVGSPLLIVSGFTRRILRSLEKYCQNQDDSLCESYLDKAANLIVSADKLHHLVRSYSNIIRSINQEREFTNVSDLIPFLYNNQSGDNPAKIKNVEIDGEYIVPIESERFSSAFNDACRYVANNDGQGNNEFRTSVSRLFGKDYLILELRCADFQDHVPLHHEQRRKYFEDRGLVETYDALNDAGGMISVFLGTPEVEPDGEIPTYLQMAIPLVKPNLLSSQNRP